MTDIRIVKMQDILAALRYNEIHAANCESNGYGPSYLAKSFCDCWCNPEQLTLVVNG